VHGSRRVGADAEGGALASGRRVGRHEATVGYWVRKYGLEAANRVKHAARGGVTRERLESLVDPSLKRIEINARGAAIAIERLREEARKCVLVCANCHAELEAGLISLPSVGVAQYNAP
jgi:hypothetical protein